MDSILSHLNFSLRIYLIATVISITIMEMVALIRRFIGLVKG